VSLPEKFLLPTRQTLLERLRNLEDQESWQQFFNTYWRLIYCTALRAGLRPDEAEDVVQETVLRVAKSIPKFNYDRRVGSFKGWLLTTTHWRIRDAFRKRDKATPLPQEVILHLNDESVSPELESIWEDEWGANMIAVALDRVKARCDPRHFQAFQLLIQQDWPPKKVSDALKTSIPKVYLIKHRLSKMLLDELEALQKEAS
jgi:RNA polymerase sigma-70 factor (ECF subfamily)